MSVQIKSVGVIGAGQMGNGIAHVAALTGYDVICQDISESALEKAKATIEKNMARIIKIISMTTVRQCETPIP